MEQIVLNWIIQHSFDQYLQSLVAVGYTFVGTNWASLGVLTVGLRYISKKTKWKWDDNLMDAWDKALEMLGHKKAPILLTKRR